MNAAIIMETAPRIRCIDAAYRILLFISIALFVQWMLPPTASPQISFTGFTSFPLATPPDDLAAGDFDADGDVDIAVATNMDGSTRIGIFLSNGNGTFASATVLDPADVCWGGGILAADFNDDGHPDLALTHGGTGGGCFGNKVTVHLGDGDRRFCRTRLSVYHRRQHQPPGGRGFQRRRKPGPGDQQPGRQRDPDAPWRWRRYVSLCRHHHFPGCQTGLRTFDRGLQRRRPPRPGGLFL